MTEPQTNPSPRPEAPASTPEVSSVNSIPDVRELVKKQLEKLGALVTEVVSQFGKDPEKDLGVKVARQLGERMVRYYSSVFLLRVEQAQALADGPWDVEPHLVLAPTLDLMHSKFTAQAVDARSKLAEFKESLTALWLSALSASANKTEGAGKPAPEALRKAAFQKATNDLAPVGKIIDELIPLVRSCYNRREIELTTRFGLGSEATVLDVLRPYLSANEVVFELARAFSQNTIAIGTSVPVVASSNAGVTRMGLSRMDGSSKDSSSKNSASRDESLGFSKRDLGVDIVEKLTAQFSAALGTLGAGEPIPAVQRALLDRAYHRGLLGIQTLGLVPEPHSDLKLLLQGEFLRAVTDAFTAIDPATRDLVAPVFAAQARALGAL